MSNRSRLVTFLVVLGSATLAQAQTFTTLYKFTGGSDGGEPSAGVIQDPSGNLYGTASVSGGGGVYELDTADTETVLVNVASGTPLIRDNAGNFYGTGAPSGSKYGAVFKIDTARKMTVLHSFTGGSDGCGPGQGLIMDKAGNLYGTTYSCGLLPGYGTIFEVSSTGKFTVLHTFGGPDGAHPSGGHLAMDGAGNLYGVTSSGGEYKYYGVLYKLSKNLTFTALHEFGAVSDGAGPLGSVLLDAAGNIYGTTNSGGSSGVCGTVWKVSKSAETILYNFPKSQTEGCRPEAGVTRDSKGNLYGVTANGGTSAVGVIYKLSASGKLTVLHSFDNSDGAVPTGEVLRTANGTLFGTTSSGGIGSCTVGCGTVWKYVP